MTPKQVSRKINAHILSNLNLFSDLKSSRKEYLNAFVEQAKNNSMTRLNN